jgi:ferritin
MFHARKFGEFIYERGGKVNLKAIKAPESTWDSPLAIFEAAYKHECHISECINKLTTLAMKEDDHAARVFLEWFVNEQVEEEANADAMVQNLKLMQNAPGGLFMLDREAGQRVVNPLIIASITGAAAGA